MKKYHLKNGDEFVITFPKEVHTYTYQHICCDCGARHHIKIKVDFTKRILSLIFNKISKGEAKNGEL